jgi:imidazolonepropionase-like amidohydrolase
VVFEGARVIFGDQRPPLEDAAFVVAAGRFAAVGPRGQVVAPADARHVDLTGKTVMPTMIDAHAHIGYMHDLTSGPENYTRENILDHLHRYAYFGVSAVQAMGSDYGELPYQLRDETARGEHRDAARFLTAGRGLAPEDEIRPDNMRHSAYKITTEAEARASVRDLADRGVSIVKTWVDDRGGRVRKLTPALYGAIIDEAHQRGMRVMVHALALDDAKALLRAGVDGFGHMIEDVDEEFLALVGARPHVFFLFALGGPRRLVSAPWIDPPHPLIVESVTPQQIERLRTRLASETPAARTRASMAWEALARGITKLAAARARIGVGTDGGGQTGDQFVGWTVHTEVENMVHAGMTPADVLVAATGTSADILGLDDLGTVSPGKSADFLVLDANPLDDITNTRRIVEVYLRGDAVNRGALRAGWTSSVTVPR